MGVRTAFAVLSLGLCVLIAAAWAQESRATMSGTVTDLSTGDPVANAVLTCSTEAQAWARAEEKGRDAARVAVEMANLLEDL